jgi:DNA-binding NtrC family response regulator
MRADFRLLAATNKTLKDEVAEGRFRKDLLYRLNVITLRVPPLRDRVDDIQLLAAKMVGDLANELGRRPPKLSEQAMRKLTEYPWPGNVRELRNVLERAMLISTGPELRGADIALEESVATASAGPPRNEWEIRPLDEVAAEYVRDAVAATGGNMRKAARLLKISPSTLYAKLKE